MSHLILQKISVSNNCFKLKMIIFHIDNNHKSWSSY